MNIMKLALINNHAILSAILAHHARLNALHNHFAALIDTLILRRATVDEALLSLHCFPLPYRFYYYQVELAARDVAVKHLEKAFDMLACDQITHEDFIAVYDVFAAVDACYYHIQNPR